MAKQLLNALTAGLLAAEECYLAAHGRVAHRHWHTVREQIQEAIDSLQAAGEPSAIEALTPFAALYQEHHLRQDDERPAFGINNAVITVGDLRRAAWICSRATEETTNGRA